jgi:hypothetical protein
VGADVPSLRTFFEIDHYAPSCMCYHIDGEVPLEEAPKLTPLDQSPYSHAIYLQEKADRL